MLIDFMLKILDSLITWVISIRPAWEVHLPSGVQSFVATMMAFNGVVPIAEVMLIISLLVGVVFAMQIWKWTIKVVDWIADVLP